jgi:hypothetical protein
MTLGKNGKINQNSMGTVYFQPPGIRKEYCEVGTILETDKDYIYYLDEPCKILISEVKIIDKENVVYDKALQVHCIKSK